MDVFRLIGTNDVVVDGVFSAMYFVKIARYVCMYVAAYVARVLFVNRYVDRVVYDAETPPPMTHMIAMLVVGALFLESFVTCCLMLIASAQQRGGAPLVPVLRNPATVAAYFVDVACTLVVTLVISSIVGRLVGSRVAYDYVNNGSRAARTFESIVQYVALAVYSVPFFLLI